MITKDRVREALKGGVIVEDGHSLFSPEFYAPYFTAEELADLTETHESDGTYKGSIFGSDGKVIQKLVAIYNLSFLYWLAYEIGVGNNVWQSGRGSQAQELVRQIRQAVAVENE